jgi:hypothetical protein
MKQIFIRSPDYLKGTFTGLGSKLTFSVASVISVANGFFWLNTPK